MWVQVIESTLKPGKEAELAGLMEQLKALEQPGSGVVQSIAAVSQQDRQRAYTIVIFESEEAARSREADPRRDEGLAAVRANMAEIFDGPPEFVNLDVVAEYSTS